MVSFEIFVKAMPPSLSELKVLPSFCFAFKIPDDRARTIIYVSSETFIELDQIAKCHNFSAFIVGKSWCLKNFFFVEKMSGFYWALRMS